MSSKEKKAAAPWPPEIPIKRENAIMFGIGFVVLVLGYLALSVGPWDSFLSRTLAPIILLVGYLVIFPLAIFRSAKGKE